MTVMKTALTLGGLLALSAGARAGCWLTPAEPSPLGIVASQAGAPISGAFTRYSGRLCLPDAGQPGSARVEIDTASIDMGTPEFDAEMRGPLFLDVSSWPTAEFIAESVTPLGEDRYRVTGALRIRDITLPLTSEFTTRAVDGGLRVSAEVIINRLDFDLGLGEWQDTRWVGAEVTIRAEADLVPAGD
jgi:polyisoprenoid-binding protein YceI